MAMIGGRFALRVVLIPESGHQAWGGTDELGLADLVPAEFEQHVIAGGRVALAALREQTPDLDAAVTALEATRSKPAEPKHQFSVAEVKAMAETVRVWEMSKAAARLRAQGCLAENYESFVVAGKMLDTLAAMLEEKGWHQTTPERVQ
jgi:hypothetical protein